MNFYFHTRHKVWIENQIYDLFDGEILQSVMPDMKPVEENLRFNLIVCLYNTSV